MKRAMVSELKAHLSTYLSEVRKGNTIVICDRATPIARLVPYDAEVTGDFEVAAASLPAGELRTMKRVRLKRGVDVVRLLREDRDQR